MIIYQFGVITQQCVNSLLYFVLQVESHHAIHPCVEMLGSVSVHYSHRLSPSITKPVGSGLFVSANTRQPIARSSIGALLLVKRASFVEDGLKVANGDACRGPGGLGLLAGGQPSQTPFFVALLQPLNVVNGGLHNVQANAHPLGVGVGVRPLWDRVGQVLDQAIGVTRVGNEAHRAPHLRLNVTA
jgi:hypothetical protein